MAKAGKPRLRALPYVPPEERRKVEVPAIGGVCDECLKKNAVGNSRVLAVYCSHFQTGAAMALKDGEPVGLWQMYGPITAEAWADALISGHAIVAELLSQKLAASAGFPGGSHSTEH